MGIFGRSRDAPRKEKRTAPTKEMQEFIRGVDVDFIGNSNSGINVDEMRAMQTSAVYACVKILAETIASLPLHLYKKDKGGKNEMAEQHPLFSCLYEFPNEEMTSFEFRETMMTSLLLWGNAYARIIRKQGHTTELWYLKPNQMVVERDSVTGKIKYTYSDEITNQTYVYRPDQIFHVKSMSIDGVKGLSPIAQAREAVGLALATEEYGAKFFGNGARPGGVLEHPGTLKDPEKLRQSWNQVYQGTRNSHKVAVLEEGMKYHTIGIAPEDAQFLETRKYQVNEICRIFRVPPHLVGDLERATFSNIEHQSMDDRKRAVAYIRVSTKSDAQLHSFGYQESYWRDAIAASNQYDFAGIYSDFGISGRSLNRRPQLQRLITDAEQKKFDVVFTKSVARFGRNVEEIVATVRKLREYGIRIFFEKEQIDTFDPNMELYMTLAASIAENDLKIYSENMTWSIRERYKKGWISIGSQIFGYRMNKENNTLIVEPTEAETVRRIYDLYEEGLGQVAISHVLEEEQRANIYGKVQWDVGAIRYILTNEKYKGCALTQKGIYVHGTRQKNDNLAPQWYMENTHEAIITPEQFERVQELIKERARKSKGAKPGDYVFARKIECGCCGGGYSHKFNNTNKPWRSEIWICSKQNTYGAGHCSNTRIKDEVLKKLFVECYNEFVRENGNTDELLELRDNQRKLLEQERELNALRVNRMIEISDYNAEIAKVREQITECNKQIALHEMRGARKEDLVELKEFDDSKVEIFLEKAVVLNHTITFTFINGMSISREYTNGHGGNTAGWLDRRLDRLSKEGKQ